MTRRSSSPLALSASTAIDDLRIASGLLMSQSPDQPYNRHLAATLPETQPDRSSETLADGTKGSRQQARRTSIQRQMQPILHKLLLSVSFPAALLLAWQLSAHFGWLPDQILPAPSLVIDTMRDRLADGSLWDDTKISLIRVLRGFALGAAIGLALGAAMATSRRLYAYLHPLFLAIGQVPILGWVPLLILLIGIDEGLKTTLVALAVFIPVTLGTYQGIRDVPSAYREVGRVLTFTPRQVLTTIILPAASPAIFTGLREGLSNGWQTLVAVELLASTEGLGYQMAYGRQLFQLELVIAAMLVIGLIGFLSDSLLGEIEKRLQRWKVAS